jgi:exodeoxyribonuclease V alpha subunit
MEMQEMTVVFDNREVIYDFSELDELIWRMLYQCTNQGSEYAAVVLPLVTQHFMLLQRNLIYTAVARAKNW